MYISNLYGLIYLFKLINLLQLCIVKYIVSQLFNYLYFLVVLLVILLLQKLAIIQHLTSSVYRVRHFHLSRYEVSFC